MRIKLRTTMAGPTGTYLAGAIIELGDKQAQQLIDGGYAERISEPIIESAVLESAPEKAVIKKPEKKKRGK